MDLQSAAAAVWAICDTNWPWAKTPSSSMACHIPAACVRVWTMTDIFTSQSTSSVPSAHFRINFPDTCWWGDANRKRITKINQIRFTFRHLKLPWVHETWAWGPLACVRLYLSVFQTTGAVGDQEHSQRPSDPSNGRTRRFGDGQRRIRMVGTVRTTHRRCLHGRRNATTETCTAFKKIELVALCYFLLVTQNGTYTTFERIQFSTDKLNQFIQVESRKKQNYLLNVNWRKYRAEDRQ